MYMLQMWVIHSENKRFEPRPEMTFFYRSKKNFDKYGQPRIDQHRNKPLFNGLVKVQFRLYEFDDTTHGWILTRLV